MELLHYSRQKGQLQNVNYDNYNYELFDIEFEFAKIIRFGLY